jgi:hypothetical protein
MRAHLMALAVMPYSRAGLLSLAYSGLTSCPPSTRGLASCPPPRQRVVSDLHLGQGDLYGRGSAATDD